MGQRFARWARKLLSRSGNTSEPEAGDRVVPGHPVGHYYSPIVDPEEARKFLRKEKVRSPERIPGIRISMKEMSILWEKLSSFVATTDMPMNQEGRCRYYAANDVYPIGDAAILRAMILQNRPRRIIEIGSGFSSACMLDAAEEGGLDDTRMIFIEPYPGRLRSLLRGTDLARCEIVEAPVQAVDLGLFDQLGQDDILFIDSTHVLKTASDVNFELFQVLPRLKKGVLIHFHDIMYPFEYPNEWIFNRRYSWNEIYALRAFLMYNNVFRIEFFNSLFIGRHRELVKKTYPPMETNPATGIWIRKVE